MANDINWFPGHMRKALNETKDKLKLVDIVYETADARIPFSSRNPELDRIIGDKPRIVILNKADLADPNKTAAWINSLGNRGVCALAMEASHKKGFDRLTQATENMLREKLENAAARGRTGRPMRAMVVGAPNTGKSTLINGLAGKKAAVTGDRPGVTRDFKWIQTPGRLELMDMPGVLWPKIATRRSAICLTACGSIKEDVTDVVETAYDTLKLLIALYPDLIEQRYGIDTGTVTGGADLSGETPEICDNQFASDPLYDLFILMAKKRGCVMSGGRADEMRFAKLLINDFREGRIGRITLEAADKPEKER